MCTHIHAVCVFIYVNVRERDPLSLSFGWADPYNPPFGEFLIFTFLDYSPYTFLTNHTMSFRKIL